MALFSKTLKSTGKILVETDHPDGEGVRIAKDFLSRLLEEFARQSKKYIDIIPEAPFAFSERQLHSILAPALSQVADAFLMECPIQRKWSEMKKLERDDSHGWVDYWCRYRDRDFFLEIKHSFDAFKTDTIRKYSQVVWQEAIDQLKPIRGDVLRISENSRGAILLPILFIPIYEYLKKDHFPQSIQNWDRLVEIQGNYRDGLSPSPTWRGLWMLHEQLARYCYSETRTHYEYYPGVLMLSRIAEVLS